LVDGEPFEVWIESLKPTSPTTAATQQPATATSAKPKVENSNGKSARLVGNHPEDAGKVIRAPIPGVILSIAVREGTEVAIGQDLCILEAMKMKNSIRSPRKGIIAGVPISVGQAVRHHEILMEFTE